MIKIKFIFTNFGTLLRLNKRTGKCIAVLVDEIVSDYIDDYEKRLDRGEV